MKDLICASRRNHTGLLLFTIEFHLHFSSRKILRAWIGLSDKKKEGKFVWVASGVGYRYKNWKSSEPNGGRKENCVEMIAFNLKWKGKWTDKPCERKKFFVCEKNKKGKEKALVTLPDYNDYYNDKKMITRKKGLFLVSSLTLRLALTKCVIPLLKLNTLNGLEFGSERFLE